LPGIYPAGFVKSPSAALRCSFVVAARPLVRLTPQFLRALHVGASSARPYRQNHRSAGFFEIINPDSPEKRLFFSRMSAAALHRHQPDGGLGAGRRKRFANPVRIRYHE